MFAQLMSKTVRLDPLTGSPIAGESGPGSNSNKEVLHIPKSYRTGDSPSDALLL